MLVVFLVIVGVFLLDQESKLFIQERIEQGQSVPLLGDFVRLTHIRNPGGAFGLRLGGQVLYTLLSIVAIFLLVIYFLHLPRYGVLPQCSLSLILGGAMGNVLDRFRFGEVVDFLDVGVGNHRWPVFNLADGAVTVGIILLMVSLRGGNGRREKEDGCGKVQHKG